MALAEFRDVAKAFGDVIALQGLTLEARSGEVLGLIGPNGAGKTTALRILCGLLVPDAGTASVGGHDVVRSPLEARRRLTFVPEGAPLYANLSPRQHLLLVGRLHGLEEAELGREAERLMEVLDLAQRIDEPVSGFSRGMRQKVALACAILPRPDLLVLDEPLTGLDAPTAMVVKEVLRAWADRGGSVLYTSHLLDVVERVCDRIAILSRGALVAEGSLDDLRRRTGRDGTLDEVFGEVTSAGDPVLKAREVLGEQD